MTAKASVMSIVCRECRRTVDPGGHMCAAHQKVVESQETALARIARAVRAAQVTS